MSDNLLIQTLKGLHSKERVDLCKFAECSIFNRRPEVLRLCRYIMQHLEKDSSANLHQLKLFEASYPGEPYDNGRLRHVFSYLLEVVRQFIAYQDWVSDPLAQTRSLCRAARKRGLDRLFEKTLETADLSLSKCKIRDARYQYLQYQILQEHLEYEARQARTANLNLSVFPEVLTQYYAAEILRHACLALSAQATRDQTYEFEWLELLLQSKSWYKLIQIPVVAVYYQLYRSLLPNGDAHFAILKEQLSLYQDSFSVEELRGLHLLAINVCIRRMNTGNRGYVKEAFDLYKSALSSNVLTENGLLSSFTYKNIIRIAAALQEHSWAEAFAEQYKEKLHPKEKNNLYYYNLAFLYFQKQDYKRAMPLLKLVELDDPLNNLDARRMLLRTYFELEEWIALDSHMQSFSAYLRRQRELGYHRTTNENLLYFVKKAISLKPRDKKARISLLQEVETTPDIAERNWLLQVLKV